MEGSIADLHDICLVCGWEDDEVQNEDSDFSVGANKKSLNEHRKLQNSVILFLEMQFLEYFNKLDQ